MSKTVATYVQKVGLIGLTGGFGYSGHKFNCLFKIVNHWDKRDNGVMCTGKEIQSGLKLVRSETNIVVHTCKLLLRTIVGSTDRASSQQLQMWFSEHFFAPKLAA